MARKRTVTKKALPKSDKPAEITEPPVPVSISRLKRLVSAVRSAWVGKPGNFNDAANTERRQIRRLAPRRLTPASYRSRHKRRKAEKIIARNKMAGSFRLFGRAMMVLRNHWEVFGGLFLIFALVNTILSAGTLLSLDLKSIKSEIQSSSGISTLGVGLALFETLFTQQTGAASGQPGAYQTIFAVIMSLAIIWALRQVTAGNRIRIRDALYNSTYPLIPLLLVFIMLTIHLVPAVIGSFVLNGILSGIFTVLWQEYIAGFIVFLLFVWSVYLLAGSVIALYIVTLPEMTPLQALRAAKDIVRYRRLTVLRKIVFLPFILLVLAAIIVVPLGLWQPMVATIVFFAYGMAALPIIHSYMYCLYRELLKRPAVD